MSGKRKIPQTDDIALGRILKDLDAAELPDINPFGADTMESDPASSAPASSAVAARKAARTPRRAAAPQEGASGGAAGRSLLYLSAQQRESLDTALACYRLVTKYRGSMASFLVEMVERGLEASAPQAYSVYESYRGSR